VGDNPDLEGDGREIRHRACDRWVRIADPVVEDDAALLEAVKIALLLVVTVSEVGFALWLLMRGPRETNPGAVAV